MVLCWNESQGSSIHAHANSHCFLKVLEGKAREELFDWPNSSEGETEMTKLYEKGLHRVENPSHSEKLVTLHLYSPPFQECKTFDQKTGKCNISKTTFWSEFGKRTPFAEDIQQQIIRETFHLVSKRDENICNFLEGGTQYMVNCYKKKKFVFLALFILICKINFFYKFKYKSTCLCNINLPVIDKNFGNDLFCLCFPSIHLIGGSDYKCEIQALCYIVFCVFVLILQKVHYILSELVMGGMVLETNMTEILTRIDEQNKLEKSEAGITAAPARAVSAVKDMNIPQKIKDIKLPDLPSIGTLKF
ncbi:hypothetical protein KUTeg_017279 [Tegillarca granosa]|uniref:Cysteine dioxygenase n=1 Tax=Tegillarca granosa TaxID=220873 RepID=A0ABQ9EIP7_TEGGR|nr:hypothetical protein KUTeg_017279 [Tegillarca granosa]